MPTLAAALPYVGLALSAAAAGTGVAASSAEQRAMENTTQNTVNQEEALQKKASPIYQQNFTASTPKAAQGTIASGVQQALGTDRNIASATSASPISNAPPSNQVSSRTQADIARQQQASANLQGVPALQSAWNVGNTGTNAQLGNIGSIGQSIASVFPAQLAAAKNSQAGLSGVSGLLGGAGSVAGAYGNTYTSNQNYQNILALLREQAGLGQQQWGTPNYSIDQ